MVTVESPIDPAVIESAPPLEKLHLEGVSFVVPVLSALKVSVKVIFEVEPDPR
jgi:hypothetical protein